MVSSIRVISLITGALKGRRRPENGSERCGTRKTQPAIAGLEDGGRRSEERAAALEEGHSPQVTVSKSRGCSAAAAKQ